MVTLVENKRIVWEGLEYLKKCAAENPKYTLYRNGRIVSDGIAQNGDILVSDGKILSVSPRIDVPDCKIIDLHGNYISAGFIDLHCHGGNGSEFIDATAESILNACRCHAEGGTRVLYPTISATDFDTMWKSLEAIEAVYKDCPVEIPGVHLEGPYLAASMCGAQDTDCIRKPVEAEYTALADRFGKLIARWTYAPEQDDGKFLDFLQKRGIVASIGHSAAEYCHVSDAYAHGCKLITHFYSCTSTITRHGGFRHLGIVESAYLLDDMYVEAIGDGCHLPKELLQLIYKLKGSERICLITDAIRYAGMENSANLQSTGNVPYVIEDGVAKLADRSAFAGSIATTGRILRSVCAAGIPMPEVVRMLTQTPACVMNLANKGRIAAGYDAQFTVFNAEYEILKVD